MFNDFFSAERNLNADNFMLKLIVFDQWFAGCIWYGCLSIWYNQIFIQIAFSVMWNKSPQAKRDHIMNGMKP